MTLAPVRVMVVDDSAVVRGLMTRALESDDEVRVVATAMQGEAALSVLRRQPIDVVVLDVEMPVMDGLTALKAIKQDFPHVQVIMASALTQEGAETTMAALRAGAASCVAKPSGSSASSGVKAMSEELVPLVKALSHRRPAEFAETTTAEPKRVLAPAPAPIRLAPLPPTLAVPRIVAIGSSTGGPQALRDVLCSLPRNFATPIVIVQHMPATFTPLLARHLELDTGRICIEARHGMTLEPRTTYVAPGDYHLELGRLADRLEWRLNQDAPEHHCRPSVNPTFRSLARTFGANVLAVMLTGMGQDGLEGTREIVQQGGHVIAQDEATSVVWGMPGAICREALAHEILPIQLIADAVARRTAGEKPLR